MRIALNTLFVAGGVAGGRVYCEGLLRGLAAVDVTNEYVVYTRRETELPELPPNRFRQVRAPVSDSSNVWRMFWEYGILPGRVRGEAFDLLHGLGSLSPAVGSCCLVLTVHDLIHRHFPHSVPLGHRLFMRHILPQMARRAERIIVPSFCTARDVVEHLGVSPERVRLVHYGPGNEFRRAADEEWVAGVLAKYGLRRPFLLSVSRAYAHKNLAGLLRSFACLRGQGHTHLQLALVGERYRTGHALARLCRELKLDKQVVFTGFVSNDELSALYSAAAVFAFPSLAEGWGLPVLEAMACGAPVVASNASALPEAVGEAGLLADAYDPESFAAALAKVMDDSVLQRTLSQKGLARARQFSWEASARGHLAVYQELTAERESA
jgi:glycosyltransferase involved in cell wall biosynthesis